jgi:hypothetical protein
MGFPKACLLVLEEASYDCNPAPFGHLDAKLCSRDNGYVLMRLVS